MDAEQLLEKYAAGTRRFVGINLSEVDLSHALLVRINLRNATLSVTNLTGANLSRANLRGAKLNVAKLSGAKLTEASLLGANLNVANLIRADFSRADLRGASLVRTEAIRTNFREADFGEANLSGAVMKEADLSLSNFQGANLSEVNLSYANLSGAKLNHATFRRTNLRWADLSGASLYESELRQVSLSGAKLVEADLRGANLRWADLSGANLAGADLSGAKLSGSNLTGANLTGANLTDASLVHADLSHARLIDAAWGGADLSGATLTGAKLAGVSRFGLRAEGVTCAWVDLSGNGDGSQICQLTQEQVESFFNSVLPSVQVSIDAALDLGTQAAILTAYYQLSQIVPSFNRCPSIVVDERYTTLIFELPSDMWLFATAYLAILPFSDAQTTHEHLNHLLDILHTKDRENLGAAQLRHIQRLKTALRQTIDLVRQAPPISLEISGFHFNPGFLQAPTHVSLTNSNNQVLDVYRNSQFGKRRMQNTQTNPDNLRGISIDSPPSSSLPQPLAVFDFVKIAAMDEGG